jgi:hypothetical protein
MTWLWTGDLKEQVRAALEEIQSESTEETAPWRLKAALGKFAGYIAKAEPDVVTRAAVMESCATSLQYVRLLRVARVSG